MCHAAHHVAKGLALVLLTACAGQQAVKDLVVSPFARPNIPLIIAHRGGSLEAPENTVAAVQHGIEAGADWQEIDVTLSADDVVIVIHDDTVDRTTDGTGTVRDLSAHAVTRLKAGSPTFTDAQRERLGFFGVTPPDFGHRFREARVPTLREVLAIPGARLMIELKTVPADTRRRLAKKTIDAIERAKAWDRVLIGSFDAELLWTVHDLEPSLPLIGIADTAAEAEKLLNLPLSVLGVRFDAVAETKLIAPRNLAIWAWTAYNLEMAEAIVRAGANGIITDVPKKLVDVMRAPPDLYITDEAEPEEQSSP